MRLPTLGNDNSSRDVMTTFGGYNKKLSCADGEFLGMENMTSLNYPILSVRGRRGITHNFTKFQGLLAKDDLIWVDNGSLYINGTLKLGGLSTTTDKIIEKMGAYIVIMPDKKWYNTVDGTSGVMDNTVNLTSSITFRVNVGSEYNIPSYHSSVYFDSNTAQDGDYKMDTEKTSNGIGQSSELYRYSSSLKAWIVVSDTCMVMTTSQAVSGFKAGDGIKITRVSKGTWSSTYADYDSVLFNTNDNGTMCCYATVKAIVNSTNMIVELPCKFPSGVVSGENYKVERVCPEMAYITEYNNRIWGCSKDGREIYACKLGDPTNWQAFTGISTDSYAVTVGSDGEFTGAITYGGHPMFFKERSVVTVAVSSTGAHQLKETYLDGVQKGSYDSLVEMDGILYYKGINGVYGYTGNVPKRISDSLGEELYKNAKAGTVKSKYYISMQDSSNNNHMFVFDSNSGLWMREDAVSVSSFGAYEGDLLFVSNNKLYSVFGSTPLDLHQTEDSLSWNVESGNIGYADPDNKYILRIAFRMNMELISNVSLYIMYDSSDNWEHQWTMHGTGTKSFTIPLKPRRCDHFRYKLVGNGDVKILSVSKTIAEGSDIR